MAKEKKKKKQKKVKKKGKMSFQSVISLTFLAVVALIFSASSVLLFFGMMPTICAFMADRTVKKSQAMTVAAMNLAGCSPFLLKLWLSPYANDLDVAFDIIKDAKHITIIYGMAMCGYAISFAVSGVVSTFLFERGKKKMKRIEAQKKAIQDRWGIEVTGTVEMDEHGFAIGDRQR